MTIYQYTIKVWPHNRLLDELNHMGELGWELVAWREVDFQYQGNIGVFPASAIEGGMQVIMKKGIEAKAPMAVHVVKEKPTPEPYLHRVIKAIFNIKA